MAQMRYPMKTHPSPLWHGSQFEIFTQERLILFEQPGTQQGDPLSRCSCHQNGQDPSLLEAGRILHLYTQPNPITMQLCNITNANGPYTPMHI